MELLRSNDDLLLCNIAMFYISPRPAPRGNETTPSAHASHAASPRFQKRRHCDCEYQISPRQVGLTTRRTVYNAVVWSPGAASGKYLSSYPSFDLAEQAAQEWIERADAARRRAENRRRTSIARLIRTDRSHERR